MKPPKEIDGARVLEWAWSGDNPFGVVMYSGGSDVAAEIYGIAICQYPNSSVIYRFSCNKSWETKQDNDYSSIDEAKSLLPEQYKNVPVQWVNYE